MIVQFAKSYQKSYAKLSRKLQIKADMTVELFQANPFQPQLYNHSLHGRLADLRAIAVIGDIRIIFKEYHNYSLVLMITVGSHNQVYGR